MATTARHSTVCLLCDSSWPRKSQVWIGKPSSRIHELTTCWGCLFSQPCSTPEKSAARQLPTVQYTASQPWNAPTIEEAGRIVSHGTHGSATSEISANASSFDRLVRSIVDHVPTRHVSRHEKLQYWSSGVCSTVCSSPSSSIPYLTKCPNVRRFRSGSVTSTMYSINPKSSIGSNGGYAAHCCLPRSSLCAQLVTSS